MKQKNKTKAAPVQQNNGTAQNQDTKPGDAVFSNPENFIYLLNNIFGK